MLLCGHGDRAMRPTKPIGSAALASFPVEHHRDEGTGPALIRRSADRLVALATRFGYRRVPIPRPGCGNGSLRWAGVRSSPRSQATVSALSPSHPEDRTASSEGPARFGGFGTGNNGAAA